MPVTITFNKVSKISNENRTNTTKLLRELNFRLTDRMDIRYLHTHLSTVPFSPTLGRAVCCFRAIRTFGVCVPRDIDAPSSTLPKQMITRRHDCHCQTTACLAYFWSRLKKIDVLLQGTIVMVSWLLLALPHFHAPRKKERLITGYLCSGMPTQTSSYPQ